MSEPGTEDGFPVTGHGGHFGIGSPATLSIHGREVSISGKEVSKVTLDLYQCEASIVGKCLDVLDTSQQVGFSTVNPQVYARLQEIAPADLSEELTAMAGVLYRSQKSTKQLYWVSGILVSLLLVSGFLFLKQVTLNVVNWVPVEIDQTIGEPIHELMLKEYVIVEDPVLLQATGKIFDSLLPHLPIEGLKPHWTLVKSPVVNAYCLPGGAITIFTGLLKDAESPDEVAAVLAHELAHATERHGLRQMAQSASVALAIQLSLGDLGGVAAAGGEAAHSLLSKGYSRDHEREADAIGLKMLTAAGWKPLAMSNFFERLAQKGGGDQPPAWFSTHPHPGERAQVIREVVASESAGEMNRKTASPPEIDWQAVQEALGKL